MSDPASSNPTVSAPLVTSEPANAESSPPAAGDAASKAKPALKDRIADLQLAQRASAVGVRLADRMKAVQAAAPAAADLAGKVKSAAGAVRLDKLNRDALKAGRDGLAAKVEAFLKPRAVDDAPPQAVLPKPTSPESSVKADTRALPDELKPQARADIEALKARVDDALRARPTTDAQSAPGALRTETVLQQPSSTSDTDTARSAGSSAETGPADAPGASVSSRLKTGVSKLVSRRSATPTLPPSADPVAADGVPSSDATLPAVAIAGPEVATQRTRTQHTSRTAYAQAEARRPIFSLGLIATALTAGGVLHILTTFAIPAINTGSAFERLKWQLEPNVMRVMPVDANGQTALPFLTADMRYAMCRYDITQNSVQVAATLPDIGWSLALYTPQGDNFYAVPGQDGRVVTAAFTINAAGDRVLLPVPGVRRTDTDAAQVTSPLREGLVVIRAPNRGPAYLPAVEAALKGATCRVLPRR